MVSKNIQTDERTGSHSGVFNIRFQGYLSSPGCRGFALVEILIAVSILSIVLISVFSGVSTSVKALSENKNHTVAMLLARTKMNEFIHGAMRGTDVSNENITDNTDFLFSRETKRYEHPLFGQMPVKKTDITIKWKGSLNSTREKKFTVSYIYSSQ